MTASDSCLVLDGPAAGSPFRLARLLARLQSLDASVSGLAARYRHFVRLAAPLDAAAAQRLERLLNYGEPAPGNAGGARGGL
jgi:phosphoribosylformylglycinamidine synthase